MLSLLIGLADHRENSFVGFLIIKLRENEQMLNLMWLN